MDADRAPQLKVIVGQLPKSNGMAFGFPYPRYVARRTFDFPHDELFTVVESALNDLGWSYKILWGKEFEAWKPTTHWSWHHEFKVRFPSSAVVEAESRSAYREMFFDFGRNRKNVEIFFARVEQIIEPSSGRQFLKPRKG